MNVLFIGNSHTYYNDMPRIFTELANSNGHYAQVDSVTRGGWILSDFLDVRNEQSEMIERICREGNFDLCVLQEQAMNPVINYAGFKDGVSRLIDKLSEAVKGFMLYETFGLDDGNPRLLRYGLTWEMAAAMTCEAYTRLGKELGIPVSRAGTNFAQVKRNRDDIAMFLPDLTHATYAASCLIALSHYKTVFGDIPRYTAVLDLPKDTVRYFLSVVWHQSER